MYLIILSVLSQARVIGGTHGPPLELLPSGSLPLGTLHPGDAGVSAVHKPHFVHSHTIGHVAMPAGVLPPDVDTFEGGKAFLHGGIVTRIESGSTDCNDSFVSIQSAARQSAGWGDIAPLTSSGPAATAGTHLSHLDSLPDQHAGWTGMGPGTATAATAPRSTLEAIPSGDMVEADVPAKRAATAMHLVNGGQPLVKDGQKGPVLHRIRSSPAAVSMTTPFKRAVTFDTSTEPALFAVEEKRKSASHDYPECTM